MSTDEGADRPIADKDDLQRAVDERVAAAETAAGTEPVVNALPADQAAAKKTAKRTAAKKAAPAKRAPAAKKAAPAKRAPRKKAAPATSADAPATATPVVAPAPIAEPGSPTGAPVGALQESGAGH